MGRAKWAIGAWSPNEIQNMSSLTLGSRLGSPWDTMRQKSKPVFSAFGSGPLGPILSVLGPAGPKRISVELILKSVGTTDGHVEMIRPWKHYVHSEGPLGEHFVGNVSNMLLLTLFVQTLAEALAQDA